MAEAMGTARDWALIILAIEGLILSLLPLFLYLKAVQGLRSLTPRVRPFLRRVRVIEHKGERAITVASRATATPFVGLQATIEACRAFWGAYRRRVE